MWLLHHFYQLPHLQRTISILEGSVNLRRYPSPVGGPAGHRAIHTAGAGVEAPVVSASEEVDLVLLRAPDQGCMDRGPQQAQFREGCGAQDWLLTIVHPVLRTYGEERLQWNYPTAMPSHQEPAQLPPLPRTFPASVSLSCLEPTGMCWDGIGSGRYMGKVILSSREVPEVPLLPLVLTAHHPLGLNPGPCPSKSWLGLCL